ncbi:MAG: YcaO-like family protein [bacterium]
MLDDAALADIAARYREVLGGGDLCELDLTPYDRTGIPTVATVWGQGRGTVHGTGFGATPAAATVGALGELSEAVLVNPVVEALPRQRASYAGLRRERGERGVVDPVTLVLEAGSDYSENRPLDWVSLTRWRTGEEVLVPVEFVGSEAHTLPADPPPGGWLTTAITNGLGAGDSLERAVGHALLEMVQRDGDTVSYRALDTGVVIDLSTSGDPMITATVGGYRAVGIEPMVKLASTELATVVYCVGRDEKPDTPPLAVTAIGEAADVDRDGAILKALLEYGSSRVRKIFGFGPLEAVERRDPEYLRRELAEPLLAQEPRALAAMTDWARRDATDLSALVGPTLYRHTSTVAAPDLPTAAKPADPTALLTVLLDRLADFDVLVLPAGREDGMRAAKVIAPGLEVETMSYLRIGERVLRRLLDRGSDLVGLGPADGADRLGIHLTAAATERIGGPAWIDRGAVARTVGPLYPLYREPDRFAWQRLARGEVAR